MSRLSCIFCVFANEADLRVAVAHNPELYQEYLRVERAIGQTFRRRKDKKTGNFIPTSLAYYALSEAEAEALGSSTMATPPAALSDRPMAAGRRRPRYAY